MRIHFDVNIQGLLQEQITLKTIELSQIKKQIEILATFLPDEILKFDITELSNVQHYVGVLLFADVSGFTPLTEKYNKTGKGGIYRLTATLNAYIGALVEVIQFFGGDILKFSGDAFLALWKVESDDSIFDILHKVVVCALTIQKCLGKFETEVKVELKVKLAISCGNMIFSLIGDSNYKHYIILGDAITDVKQAEHVCVSGDVVISPDAWSHMIPERYEVTLVPDGHVKVWKVNYKPTEVENKLYFEEKQAEALKLIEMHLEHRNLLNAQRNFLSTLKDSQIQENFVRSLPRRASVKSCPKLWIVEQLKPFIIKPVQDQVDESQPVEYLTEMREVTIQFINIIPVSYDESLIVDLLNEAYQIVCHIVEHVLGIVNKVSLFDKDAMLLVIFGLRGVKHEMEGQNALRSAFLIRKFLSGLNGIQVVSVGITSGFVYCGVVGHPLRKEYTVIGGAVNKAARIMCAYPAKVSCDYKTFKNSKLSSFYFKLQSSLKLKGIEDAGYIFEYNEDFEVTLYEQRIVLPTVGRSAECNYIRKLVLDNSQVDNYLGVCFHGPSKMGKSEVLRFSLKNHRDSQAYIVASLALDGSSKLPYFCLKYLYRQIYDKRATIDNNSLNLIPAVPRDLLDPEELLMYDRDDIAMKKYRILNCFRDLTSLTENVPILIFIDNVEEIDLQSWEILEIVLNDKNIRLIMGANFEVTGWDLRFKMSVNKYIKIIELGPIKNRYIPTIACQFLLVAAIPKSLADLLIRSCEGRPGYVQCSLLRLMNNGSIEMKLVNKSETDTEFYYFPPELLTGHFLTDIVPIVHFSEKYRNTNTDITLHAISLDLFDSFTPYQQLVIKTGSVMGSLFSRTLLMVALKYPSDFVLGGVIKHLFEEEVFDCGSRYIYASDLDNAKICCECYFDDNFVRQKEASDSLPKYAYCKILHFKNKSIREVAYDLLPGNQRKELHLLCTDVLERINHQCPKCLRDPSTALLTIGTYKSLVKYCNNPDKQYYRVFCEYGKYDNMKDTIKNAIYANDYKIEEVSHDLHYRKVRSIVDPLACNCVEIMCRVYKDLVYHSQMANHLGKRIFFTLQYGLLLGLFNDLASSVAYLSEAREMCLINSNESNNEISDVFKRILMGRIEIGLAKVYIVIRQLKTAKNHLAIALRQYNIPTVALTYKHYSKILEKFFVVKSKRIKPFIYKNNILRHDMAVCMSVCARLFSADGNWKMAKFAASYSVFLFKRGNPNISLLLEVYCNAIDIYRFFNDKRMCEKLQEFVVKEIQFNFCNNLTFNLIYLNEFLVYIFEEKCVEGNIQAAIRMGYRVLDIHIKIFTTFVNPNLFLWMCLMLILNFRIKECVDILNFSKKTKETRPVCYYIILMVLYLHCGFIYEPIDSVLTFAEPYLKSKPRLSWSDLLLSNLINLHFLRLGKYLVAEEWKYHTSFNASIVKSVLVLFTLFVVIECKITSYLRSCRMHNINLPMEEKVIDTFLKIFKEQVETQYTVLKPVYLVLSAWMNKIKKKDKKVKKALDQAYAISVKNDNVLYKCLVVQLRNHWAGGYTIPYTDRPHVPIMKGISFSEIDLARFIYAFPLM